MNVPRVIRNLPVYKAKLPKKSYVRSIFALSVLKIDIVANLNWETLISQHSFTNILVVDIINEMILSFQLSLSNLQMKAEAEINKAQKLISEKDEELQAAEESLLGLKEVTFCLWFKRKKY